MIDLTKRTLPDTVTVDGRAFFIKTDFREWIKFSKQAEQGRPFDCSYLFIDEHPETIPLRALLEFAQPPRELPRQQEHTDAILLDFEIDADLIFAAFMEQYKIDLTEADLHWHKFLALLAGINENTLLAKVMGYRGYRKERKSKDAYLLLKRAWEIIPPPTEEEAAEIAGFDALFE